MNSSTTLLHKPSKHTGFFCHLSVRSEYSFVDGSLKISDIVDKVSKLSHTHLALTDHGGLHGAIDFYFQCRKKNIIPIIGSTIYIEPSSRLKGYIADQSQTVAVTNHRLLNNQRILKNKTNSFLSLPSCFQLTLLAKNNTGYKKLMKIVSEAYQHGLSEDDIPICSFDILNSHLSKNQKDLIFLCGGLQSQLGYLIGNYIDNSKSKKNEFNKHIGNLHTDQLTLDQKSLDGLVFDYLDLLNHYADEDHLYIELIDNNLGIEHSLNDLLVEYAQQTGISCVATANAYYLEKSDHYTHSLCIAIKNSLTEESISQRLEDADFHLLDNESFFTRFQKYPFAIENTLKIAKMSADVDLSFSKYHLPSYSSFIGDKNQQTIACVSNITDEAKDQLSDQHQIMGDLAQLAQKGLEQKIIAYDKSDYLLSSKQKTEYQNRLDYELSMINNMKFAGYFLIVQDFINWAKSHNIAVGPGRGSGAGSLVAYCLGITDVDPLRWGLIFERFLNPERISLPDFDVDFCQWRREEVIDYVTNKYGKSRVCHIVTYGKLMAKASLKNVARAMGINFLKINNITKQFPNELNIKLTEVLEQSPRIKNLINQDDRLKRAMKEAIALEGVISHTSIHAAGMIISDNPITDYAPTFRTKDDEASISQYEMKSLEKSGLVKFDFLGLKTLTVIDLACNYIKDNYQSDFDIININFDNTKVFNLLAQGHTVGVFQAESYGMTKLSKKLAPNKFEDIIALVALFRPGPLSSGMVDDFIERKHKRQSISYLHPLLEPILSETYGLIVYQEQVQKIAYTLANYSLAEADLLRRAMGKKIPKEMQKQQKRFLGGCKKNNIDNQLALQIFELMAEFAKYGFNKSHSAAYGLILYQTAYLKCHFPDAFILGIMNTDYDLITKFKDYFTEWRKMGFELVAPNINLSEVNFSISINEKNNKKKQLLFGLSSIKGLGKKTAKIIVEARNQAEFSSLDDLLTRIDLSVLGKKTWQALVYSGSLDCFKIHRRLLIENTTEILKYSNKIHNKASTIKHKSLFSLGQDNKSQSLKNTNKWYLDLISLSKVFCQRLFSLEHLVIEKDLLGEYFSASPLQLFEKEAKLLGLNIDQLDIIYNKASILDKKSEDQYIDIKAIAFLDNFFHRDLHDGKKAIDFKLSANDTQIVGSMYEKNISSHLLFPNSDSFVIIEGYVKHRAKRSSLVISKIYDACDFLGKKLKVINFVMSINYHHTNGLNSDFDCPYWLEDFFDRLKTYCDKHKGVTKINFSVQINFSKQASLQEDKYKDNNKDNYDQKLRQKTISWDLGLAVYINQANWIELRSMVPDYLILDFQLD